jgi:RNA polymerase sigma-70 factor (ECF subfamily)
VTAAQEQAPEQAPEQAGAGGPVEGRVLTLDDVALDDMALVRLALVDAEAFGVLYERYCDRIFRYVLRRLSDRAAAEDVTTEVFIKAMRGLERYRPQGVPFSAWLFRIAANATIDYLRAHRFTDPLDEAPDVAERTEPLEDVVARRVDADRAWAVVDRLTDAQRTAVILRLAHDQTVPEIARRMDRSEGAVKLLLNRGLAAARQYLQEFDDQAPPEPAPEATSTGEDVSR